MGTKGTKSSNIYQVLKGAGAWQSKDSQGPMIKGVGIKSPLNMKKASPAKAADDSIMKPPTSKKKETPKKTSYSEAYKKRDMKTYGNLSEAEYTAEAKRQNKSKKETGKWDAPKKQMESKENKTTTTDPKTTTTDPKKENVVKNTRKEVAESNKKKRQDRRAERRQKRADRIKEKGGTRVGNALRGVKNVFKKKDKKKDDSAAKMKKGSAMKMKKESPAKKALVGKQGNLPEHLKAKIKAAPGKMKKYK